MNRMLNSAGHTPRLVPAPVVALVERWLERGRPPQSAIAWPRARWVAAMPAHTAAFTALSDRIDRDSVRGAVDRALADDDVIGAFLTTMAWGFGRVGYGPHR